LTGFFVGWGKPLSASQHFALLGGSSHFVAAVDGESGNVIGFVTALTDGVNSAFIPLLEVLPAYQKRGIGSELMRGILRKLDAIPCVDLMCDAEMQTFYEKFAMFKSHGMILRKYLGGST
jgi:ribosomal protein S18 acetylase RimI-like enzyme